MKTTVGRNLLAETVCVFFKCTLIANPPSPPMHSVYSEMQLTRSRSLEPGWLDVKVQCRHFLPCDSGLLLCFTKPLGFLFVQCLGIGKWRSLVTSLGFHKIEGQMRDGRTNT